MRLLDWLTAHPPCSHPLPPPHHPRVWKRINALFNWLPLAALIESKILCMHGGIGRCINPVGGRWLGHG